MKQIEATPKRPFYSVAYQYERNPWTLHSCNRFDSFYTKEKRTQHGTDSLDEAKRIADGCLKESGVCLAQVSMTTDCYNHKTVYEVKAS